MRRAFGKEKMLGNHVFFFPSEGSRDPFFDRTVGFLSFFSPFPKNIEMGTLGTLMVSKKSTSTHCGWEMGVAQNDLTSKIGWLWMAELTD